MQRTNRPLGGAGDRQISRPDVEKEGRSFKTMEKQLLKNVIIVLIISDFFKKKNNMCSSMFGKFRINVNLPTFRLKSVWLFAISPQSVVLKNVISGLK